MSDSCHISSVRVTVDPSRLAYITRSISKLEFATITKAMSPEELLVVLKSPTMVALIHGLTDIQLMPGVASAALCGDTLKTSAP
ncbi:MAG: hypothetical protein HKN27_14050 [Silicimonas sp.]|nr:hypothetical protein [Silicimonas sp.]